MSSSRIPLIPMASRSGTGLAHRDTRSPRSTVAAETTADSDEAGQAAENHLQEPLSFFEEPVPGRAMTPNPWDDTVLDAEEESVLRMGRKKKPTPFVPESFTPESLITNRIATASSATTSSQATVQAAIARLARRDDTSFSFDSELARKVAHGELVRFKDAEEKARILALAEEHAMDTTAKRNRSKLRKLNEGEEMEFESPLPVQLDGIPAKNRQEIVDKVLRGKYELEGRGKRVEKNAALSTLKKTLDMNGTYKNAAGVGFLDMFKKFFPQTTKR
jgi:hypothetical protein